MSLKVDHNTNGDTMKQNFLLDAGVSLEKDNLIGYKKEKNIEIKHFLLKEKDEKLHKNFSSGDHFTLYFDDTVLYKELKALDRVFSKTFKTFLGKYHKGGTILFIGLGNTAIIGDSFGPRVLEQLIATNQYNDFLTIPKVALFTPDTTSKTGISSFRLIEMVVNNLKPDVIILVDSFVTKDKNYLNRSLELNDCGIAFADQLRANKTITKDTFHIPVLSIGYPSMLKIEKEFFTKFSIEEDLDIITTMVSKAINQIIMA